MKRFSVFLLLAMLVLIGCTKEQKEVKLEEGTPEYELAKELSVILPILDPASNHILISTDSFDVTSGEIIQYLSSNMGKVTEQFKNFEAERLKMLIDDNANRLAERKLLLAAANKAKSTVSQQEIDNILNVQYERAGGEEKFLQMLEENGVDIAFVKESIEKDLKIQHYLEGIFKEEISVSKEEIQSVYDADKTASVRHILLLTQEKSEEEKAEIYKKMEGILSRAKGGEDFAELAKTYSEDPGSKENGGLYENFGRGQMVPPFEEAAFAVPVGEISDIVETTFGYHIIKVVDRKKETRPFDEVRSEIEAQIRQPKKNMAYFDLLARMKEEANFKIIEY